MLRCPFSRWIRGFLTAGARITSYNVCYTKLLRTTCRACRATGFGEARYGDIDPAENLGARSGRPLDLDFHLPLGSLFGRGGFFGRLLGGCFGRGGFRNRLLGGRLDRGGFYNRLRGGRFDRGGSYNFV